MPDRIQRRTTSRHAIGCLTALVATAGLALAPAGAHAKTIDVTERARLHLVRKSGSTLDLRGTVGGTLSGPVVARFAVRVVSVTGLVTIFPEGGGSLSFAIAGNARSVAVRARFSGSVTVTGGTGRWAGARGRGSFSGIVDRRTWAATATVRSRITT